MALLWNTTTPSERTVSYPLPYETSLETSPARISFRSVKSKPNSRRNAANIGFTTNASDAVEAKAICQKICDELGLKGFELDEKVNKVSVVGVGMRTHTGVASKLFKVLAEGQVNIRHISTSEIVISVVVEEKDGTKALKLVHNAFDLHKAS